MRWLLHVDEGRFSGVRGYELRAGDAEAFVEEAAVEIEAREATDVLLVVVKRSAA